MNTAQFLSKFHWYFFRLIGIACCSLIIAQESFAIVANPKPVEHIQPDGTRITLRLKGDEFFHWVEDLDGFTVLPKRGIYVYAMLDELNHLVPGDLEVGKANPVSAGLRRRLLPPKGHRSANDNGALPLYRPWMRGNGKANAASDDQSTYDVSNISPNGTVRNLVILCRFADHTNSALIRPRADYDILFNQIGGHPQIAPTGSVRDAFTENSYGILDLQSTVVNWVTLPQNESYYAGTNNGLGGDYPNNAKRMVEDALNLVDTSVNFGQFDADNDGWVDAIDIIHSGYGAESLSTTSRIWSHRSNLPSDWTSSDTNSVGMFVKVRPYHTEPALHGASGTAITRIGVIVHETGHFFGLPDLYDTDDEPAEESEGIGSWCMMANSWGFDNSQLRPPHFSAWCKVSLGWVTPTLLSTSGVFSVTQSETSQSVYKVAATFPANEYLLIENRQPVGLDADIPQGGLAIWHIDENKASLNNRDQGYPGQPAWPGNNKHYRVALLQADGNYDLERNVNSGDGHDLFHSGGTHRIDGDTIPSTDAYQGEFVYDTAHQISSISSSASTMSFYFGLGTVLFVDRNYSGGSPDGSLIKPFPTFLQAYNAAFNGYTIMIRGNTYPEAPLNSLSKQITIRNYESPVTITQ
jgi:M6 family metalloprotease-like protein